MEIRQKWFAGSIKQREFLMNSGSSTYWRKSVVFVGRLSKTVSKSRAPLTLLLRYCLIYRELHHIRMGRDSNPRYLSVHTLSRRAQSTALAPILRKLRFWIQIGSHANEFAEAAANSEPRTPISQDSLTP
jgi:hypothetical protein